MSAAHDFLSFQFHQVYPDSDPAYFMYLDLDLASPLAAAGGNINLIDGDPSNPPYHSTIACPGCGTLDHTFGQASINGVAAGVTGVPEPSSIVLLSSGAGLLGLALLRKKRSQVC